MRIIYNKYIPFKGFTAINLMGVLFVRESKYLTERQINHEKIHTQQIRELLYLFFYIWYLVEWLFKSVKYANTKKGYYNISFEREAYSNQDNLEYLRVRKRYSFIKYLKR